MGGYNFNIDAYSASINPQPTATPAPQTSYVKNGLQPLSPSDSAHVGSPCCDCSATLFQTQLQLDAGGNLPQQEGILFHSQVLTNGGAGVTVFGQRITPAKGYFLNALISSITKTGAGNSFYYVGLAGTTLPVTFTQAGDLTPGFPNLNASFIVPAGFFVQSYWAPGTLGNSGVFNILLAQLLDCPDNRSLNPI